MNSLNENYHKKSTEQMQKEIEQLGEEIVRIQSIKKSKTMHKYPFFNPLIKAFILTFFVLLTIICFQTP